jgi:16S rRNA (guanine966-N2)-methyltransferase
MRVVAGELRGRRIDSPRTDATRPTTDKVREAVFNALSSMDAVVGARVVDAYAGTGALGIEALSRGAAHCVFIERDPGALAVLRANIDRLGLSPRCTVLASDALGALAGQRGVDLVLADPPYGFDQWGRLLEGVEAGTVVLESDNPIDGPDRWTVVRQRRYGRTFVAILRPGPPVEGTVEGE